MEVAEECERRRTVLSTTMVSVKVELGSPAVPDVTNQSASPAVPTHDNDMKSYQKPSSTKITKDLPSVNHENKVR